MTLGVGSQFVDDVQAQAGIIKDLCRLLHGK